MSISFENVLISNGQLSMTIMAVPRKLGDTSYKDLVALQNDLATKGLRINFEESHDIK